MKDSSQSSMIYAVGRVRALERYLISRAEFRQAADTTDFASAMKVIFDAGKFSDELMKLEETAELEEFLEKEESLLGREIEELLAAGDILELFLLEGRPREACPRAGRCAVPFVRDYFRHLADLLNLKVFLRIRYLERTKEELERYLLPGGFVDPGLFLQGFEQDFGEIGARLQATSYAELWSRTTDKLEENDSFVELERGLENFLMDYLRRAKLISFGPGPVFAYGLAKKRELALVRLVGFGKLNRVPAELIKERISETYV